MPVTARRSSAISLAPVPAMLPPRVALAPMAGVTDIPFRYKGAQQALQRT
jgi:hypothetical protein